MEISKEVKQYFEESYKYYITFEGNDISDYAYDYLCKSLLKKFDNLSEYEQSILDKELLQAGSGYSIPMNTYEELGIRG